MKRVSWSLDEIELVRQHFLEPDGPKYLSEIVNHSIRGILAKAWSLNLRRKNFRHPRNWSKTHFSSPRKLPLEELKTRHCPGNGNGYCGSLLWGEDVLCAEGYRIHHLLDLRCDKGHRFPIPPSHTIMK